MTKRCFDLVAASMGLIFTAPFLLVIAFLVKLCDGGPVFYRQERVGWRGRPFKILKFRTMRVGADKAGPSITRSGDSRITTIGRILRKTKLDELPQLFNVLYGEMSLVGPRPEVAKYVALYTQYQRKVLELRPGITDLASIEFRNEEALLALASDIDRFYIEYCLPKKVDLNLKYASTASLCSDMHVLLLTARAVIIGARHNGKTNGGSLSSS